MASQPAKTIEVEDAALIQDELGRVLASQTFRRASRMRELLGYVVNGTLGGIDVTERKAAREVFGKGEDFNASADPEVRIHYGRLRRKLAEYYATEGREALIMIDLPARKYGPVFVPNKSANEAASEDANAGVPESASQVKSWVPK